MDELSYSNRTFIEDCRRARELFQYISPTDIIHGASPNASSDDPNIIPGLAPLCEVVALRCKSPRVLLNVMDKDSMYTLSSGSNVDDNTESGPHIDPVARACSVAVPLAGRVCEMVVRAPITIEMAPTFIVCDLSRSKFKDLDIISGPPHFRFYAGTPITTKDGVTIGSLAILDTVPRNGLSLSQERCLTQAAAQIMSQLEMHRRVVEGVRSMRLARSLECFIAGKTNMASDANRSEPHSRETSDFPPSVVMRKFSYGLGRMTDPDTHLEISRVQEENHQTGASMDQACESRQRILARAANLIRQGFSRAEDAAVCIASLQNRLLKGPSDDRPVEIVAASTLSEPFVMDRHLLPNIDMKEHVLESLLHYYSEGHLFLPDDPLSFSPAERHVIVRQTKCAQRRMWELQLLKDAFPDAHQILFAPLWNSDVDAYTHAVFLTTSANYPVSTSVELSFLKSFCDSIATECSRIETAKVTKQKNDFVSTMSHEMRSPLHGVLASMEFLTDTPLSDYQQSLVDAVQSCGHTLLDTIEHVLDYAKISMFRENWPSETDRLGLSGAQKQRFGQEDTCTPTVPALLQLTNVVDLGVMVEEVVDALVLGQNFATNSDITDLSRKTKTNSERRPNQISKQPLRVLIDIQHEDWLFVAQPGAIRRIVLNLVGNALKYTVSGCIKVQLQLVESKDKPEIVMVLIVTDTGKGISRKFLDTLMFVPFTQENALAPGTGLGLSIVHNISTMLGGEIDIRSEVGEGTTAKVRIPLQRPLPGQVSSTTTPSTGEAASSRMQLSRNSILWLQSQTVSRRVMIHRSEHRGDELEATLVQYFVHWYNFELTDRIDCADIVVIEESDQAAVERVLVSLSLHKQAPIILSLCSTASKHSIVEATITSKDTKVTVEWITMPVGPYKLATAIESAINRNTVLGKKPTDIPGAACTAKKLSAVTSASTVQSHKSLDETSGIAHELHEMILNSDVDGTPSHVIQASETIFVSYTSQNAQVALHSPDGKDMAPNTLESHESDNSFPFLMPEPAVVKNEDGFKATTETSMQRIPDPKSVFKATAIASGVSDNNPGTINPRILVVDDNKINSSLLKNFLTRKRSYNRIDCAENGQEALDTFKDKGGDYDVIFMDISMPIMDGFEATRRVRQFERRKLGQEARGTMIIALTGLSSGKDQAEGFDAGVDIYMIKPVSLKALATLLDNWESHRRAVDKETRFRHAQNLDGATIKNCRVMSQPPTGFAITS